MCEEVLRDAVASDAHRAVAGNIAPEVTGCRGQAGIVAFCKVGYSLKTYELWHLCVGMLSVEECAAVRLLSALHSVGLVGMAVGLCGVEPFAVAKDVVGISEYLVHSSMFPSEDGLHVRI